MKRTVLARVSIIATLLVLGSSLQGTTGGSRAQGEQEYLALGDSIAAGIASSLPSERGYPAILRELIQDDLMAGDAPSQVQLTNLAEPGETAQTFIEDGQLDAALERIDADDALQTVTLTLGGNTMLSLRDASEAERESGLEAFSEAYQQVIDELAGAVEGTGTDVAVTTYYDLSDGDPEIEGTDAWWIARFNQVIEDAASGAGFEVVDLAGLFEGRISELTWYPADVHPNNEGHEAIAAEIWQALGYDQSPPEVTITRPEDGEVDSRIPTIHAEITDGVGVDSVEIYAGDERVGDLLYVADQEAWIGIWDGREFEASDAELRVVATDLAGNEGTDSVPVRLPPR